jgi:hypothetical protein
MNRALFFLLFLAGTVFAQTADRRATVVPCVQGGPCAVSSLTVAGVAVGSVTIGTFGTSPDAKGATASGSTITMQPADATHPGEVTTGTQSFAGNKTFTGTLVGGTLQTDDGVVAPTSNSAALGIEGRQPDVAGVEAVKVGNIGALTSADDRYSMRFYRGAGFSNGVAGVTTSGKFDGAGALLSGTLALTATSTNTITSATADATTSTTVGAFTFKPTVNITDGDIVYDFENSAGAHTLMLDEQGRVYMLDNKELCWGGGTSCWGHISGDTNGTLSIVGLPFLGLGNPTLATCAVGIEGQISRDVASGIATGKRTKLCLCTSDGSSTYKWQNIATGTLGTTTACGTE